MTSFTPRGAPCVLEVPAKLGAPYPIVVLQAIRDGFHDFFALTRAILISLWL